MGSGSSGGTMDTQSASSREQLPRAASSVATTVPLMGSGSSGGTMDTQSEVLASHWPPKGPTIWVGTTPSAMVTLMGSVPVARVTQSDSLRSHMPVAASRVAVTLPTTGTGPLSVASETHNESFTAHSPNGPMISDWMMGSMMTLAVRLSCSLTMFTSMGAASAASETQTASLALHVPVGNEVVMLPNTSTGPSTATVPFTATGSFSTAFTVPITSTGPFTATAPVTWIGSSSTAFTVPITSTGPSTATVPVTWIGSSSTAFTVPVTSTGPPTATVPVTWIGSSSTAFTVPVTSTGPSSTAFTVPVTSTGGASMAKITESDSFASIGPVPLSSPPSSRFQQQCKIRPNRMTAAMADRSMRTCHRTRAMSTMPGSASSASSTGALSRMGTGLASPSNARNSIPGSICFFGGARGGPKNYLVASWHQFFVLAIISRLSCATLWPRNAAT